MSQGELEGQAMKKHIMAGAAALAVGLTGCTAATVQPAPAPTVSTATPSVEPVTEPTPTIDPMYGWASDVASPKWDKVMAAVDAFVRAVDNNDPYRAQIALDRVSRITGSLARSCPDPQMAVSLEGISRHYGDAADYVGAGNYDAATASIKLGTREVKRAAKRLQKWM